MAILDCLSRGSLADLVDSPTGFKGPRAIRYLDDIHLDPGRLHPKMEFVEKQKELNRIRYEAVRELGDSLHFGVRASFWQAKHSTIEIASPTRSMGNSGAGRL